MSTLLAPALPRTIVWTAQVIEWKGTDECSYRARPAVKDDRQVWTISRSEKGQRTGRRVAILNDVAEIKRILTGTARIV